MKSKCLALVSGGLDSLLILYIAKLELNLDVTAFHLNHPFKPEKVIDLIQRHCEKLDIPLIIDQPEDDYLDLIIQPQHGRGKNMNPCRDCRIYTLKRAAKVMEQIGASCLITGEVIGQRPMTQMRHYMNYIEKHAQLRASIFRPLSGKLFSPLQMELDGAYSRDQLYDFSGRGRKQQKELAEKFHITDYPQPAGGCLLTDQGFSRRVEDLINHEMLSFPNINLVRTGRHFRLSENAKVIVGRNERENNTLLEVASSDDFILDFVETPAPLALLQAPELTDELISLSAAIMLSYTRKAEDQNRLHVLRIFSDRSELIRDLDIPVSLTASSSLRQHYQIQ